MELADVGQAPEAPRGRVGLTTARPKTEAQAPRSCRVSLPRGTEQPRAAQLRGALLSSCAQVLSELIEATESKKLLPAPSLLFHFLFLYRNTGASISASPQRTCRREPPESAANLRRGQQGAALLLSLSKLRAKRDFSNSLYDSLCEQQGTQPHFWHLRDLPSREHEEQAANARIGEEVQRKSPR